MTNVWDLTIIGAPPNPLFTMFRECYGPNAIKDRPSLWAPDLLGDWDEVEEETVDEYGHTFEDQRCGSPWAAAQRESSSSSSPTWSREGRRFPAKVKVEEAIDPNAEFDYMIDLIDDGFGLHDPDKSWGAVHAALDSIDEDIAVLCPPPAAVDPTAIGARAERARSIATHATLDLIPIEVLLAAAEYARKVWFRKQEDRCAFMGALLREWRKM